MRLAEDAPLPRRPLGQHDQEVVLAVGRPPGRLEEQVGERRGRRWRRHRAPRCGRSGRPGRRARGTATSRCATAPWSSRPAARWPRRTTPRPGGVPPPGSGPPARTRHAAARAARSGRARRTPSASRRPSVVPTSTGITSLPTRSTISRPGHGSSGRPCQAWSRRTGDAGSPETAPEEST